MEVEVNLLKIFKEVPVGTKFYSDICGEMTFKRINDKSIFHPLEFEYTHPLLEKPEPINFDGYGRSIHGVGQCQVFPSKEERDWDRFKLDYPIDTPMMVSNDEVDWSLRFQLMNLNLNSMDLDKIKSIVNSNLPDVIKERCIIQSLANDESVIQNILLILECKLKQYKEFKDDVTELTSTTYAGLKDSRIMDKLNQDEFLDKKYLDFFGKYKCNNINIEGL